MTVMTRIPAEPALLDDDALDAPLRLTAEDVYTEGGPGWRRRADPALEEDDQ